ncbi:DUF3566 domain-containing protein [Nocardioides nematodiphilus]|jgi:hypothetical protein|uniref:DUF3566 domain-containing protein n=1 Tax=Nocardioides nematodiphilus TaxID=2849669 RepID=UPI001CD92306|nr:DUF3566 domain-containing protein [Nocardioides nematodiphilus]MCA1984389.1 DUF3566 domain-containing protein [Nocardioides nematodiphilus]
MTERPSTDTGREDTAVRPLTKRVQEKLAAAAEEARRNATAPTVATPAAATRGPRRARLRLTRIDPWSVMKTAFLLSVALGIVMIVSVAIVWGVLSAAGVWDSVNRTVQDIVGSESSTFNVEDYLGTSRVLGFTMVVSVIDVVLLTAVATLGAFLYNMAAALIGGIEVTLAEDN